MPFNSQEAFARNVKTLLGITELKRYELAELCGLPATRISEILGGRYGKSLDAVDLICHGFNSHFGEEVITPERLISERFEIPTKILSKTA